MNNHVFLTEILKSERKTAQTYIDTFRNHTGWRSLEMWENFTLWVILKSKEVVLGEYMDKKYDLEARRKDYEEAVKKIRPLFVKRK